MARLIMLWVLHTTSNSNSAGTDDDFTLEFPPADKTADALDFSLSFGDLPHNEREAGRTDQYEFPVEDLFIRDEDFTLNDGQFKIRTQGSDAWLPQSFWIIGENEFGERKLLVAIPNWPADRLFSTDRSEGEPIWALAE